MDENVTEIFTRLKERSGLSWDRISALSGIPKATLQYYRKADVWRGRKFELDFVAKLVPVLINTGEPPIVEKDVWELADIETGIILSRAPVSRVPVLQWTDFARGTPVLALASPASILEVVGLKAGNHAAVLLLDDCYAQVERAGAYVVIDLDDIELRDDRVYIVMIDEQASMRRYHANPARFDSLSIPPEKSYFPNGPIEILGRVIRAQRVTHL